MNYYQFPQFAQPYYPMYPPQQPQPQQPQFQDEQSYIENILRLNLGKMVSVYMNFENSQWGSKVFKGKLEAAGKDHIIISEPQTGIRYLLLSIYLDYITFDEEINYYYPYQQNLGK
jgi:spore germination protein Q